MFVIVCHSAILVTLLLIITFKLGLSLWELTLYYEADPRGPKGIGGVGTFLSSVSPICQLRQRACVVQGESTSSRVVLWLGFISLGHTWCPVTSCKKRDGSQSGGLGVSKFYRTREQSFGNRVNKYVPDHSRPHVSCLSLGSLFMNRKYKICYVCKLHVLHFNLISYTLSNYILL